MNKSTNSDLVQYIVVRNDLGQLESGSLRTGLAASSTAAVHLYCNSAYFKSIDDTNINKIILEVGSEHELMQLEDKLFSKNVDYKIWAKTPKSYPACISIQYYSKTNVQKYLEELSALKY